MTYPEYSDVKRTPSLPPSRQKAIIDALTRLHPVGSEWEIGGVRK